MDTHEREQCWTDPATGQSHQWRERVLLVRSHAFWRKERLNRQRALEKLTAQLVKLGEVPLGGRGRRRYRTREGLESAPISLTNTGG